MRSNGWPPAPRDSKRRISVHVYEPHPTPGAGPVYDPGQPEYLRMNFSADLVDMWPAREHDPARPGFSEWRLGIQGASDEAYPPRALVGRYLADGFRRVVDGAPEGLEIVHLAERATEVTRAAGGWKVSAGGDREYDEVLIATGHAGYAIYPVERSLSLSEVPPGSVVAVRGFALTMIDAALALTEGRGGSFHPGRRPGLLRYERGADEVASILPWSRTGRPMLAKPDPAKAISSPSLDEIASEGRAELASLPRGSSVAAATQVVAGVAAKSLRSVGGPEEELKAIAARMEDATAGRATPSDSSPADDLERSISVGLGIGEPGADWALGHAWRSVYPAIVERLGAHGLADAEWPGFRHLAAEMERIAFGPPPVNAAKLLALIEDGKVDLSRLTSGPAREADLVLDAVIPPPGALATEGSLVARAGARRTREDPARASGHRAGAGRNLRRGRRPAEQGPRRHRQADGGLGHR